MTMVVADGDYGENWHMVSMAILTASIVTYRGGWKLLTTPWSNFKTMGAFDITVGSKIEGSNVF